MRQRAFLPSERPLCSALHDCFRHVGQNGPFESLFGAWVRKACCVSGGGLADGRADGRSAAIIQILKRKMLKEAKMRAKSGQLGMSPTGMSVTEVTVQETVEETVEITRV